MSNAPPAPPFTQRLLHAEPCDSPYPLLAMLATSALLSPDIGSADGSPALTLSVEVERGRRPLPDAAVYIARRGDADAHAVQVCDGAGIARFRLHRRLPCKLRVKVYLTDESGLLQAIASDCLELPEGTASEARLRLAIASDVAPDIATEQPTPPIHDRSLP